MTRSSSSLLHRIAMAKTTTPIHLSGKPSKAALVEEFVGKPLTCLRTPAFIIDRSVFARNCSSMSSKTMEWGASFRAHLKTHKVRSRQLVIIVGKVIKDRTEIDSGGDKAATRG